MENHERLKNIEEQISIINNKIDKIIELIQKQQITQKKLEDHIDFVESTYDTLKSPLNFVKDKINSLTGATARRQLPDFPRQITKLPI
jgi:archaellum component FlaC